MHYNIKPLVFSMTQQSSAKSGDAKTHVPLFRLILHSFYISANLRFPVDRDSFD